MTASAQRFVGRATFDALASARTHVSLWDDERESPHTWLGQHADVIVVAPATARLLSSYAAGSSQDLLVTTLLATRAPVVVAPAMHTEMWEHAATQANVATLRQRGVHVVEPAQGELAGGDIGVGRLAEIDDIVRAVNDFVGPSDMAGRSVVVTAGGTREPIDAVRYVGNRSSGKQGFALAQTALRRGAHVTLITTVEAPQAIRNHSHCTIVMVNTASEMHDLVVSCVASHTYDAVVMAAAVADYTIARPSEIKLKKSSHALSIELVPTVDVLAALGQRRAAGEIEIGVLVGFAAETNDVVANAQHKLKTKQADVIVANDVSDSATGFGSEHNRVVIVEAGQTPKTVDLAHKTAIADAIWDVTIARLDQIEA